MTMKNKKSFVIESCPRGDNFISSLAINVISNLDVPIIVLDNDNKIIYANESTLKFTKYTSRQLLSKDWIEVFKPRVLDYITNLTYLSYEDSRSILCDLKNNTRYKVSIHDKNGNLKIMEIWNTIISYDGLNYTFIYGKDITEYTDLRVRFEHLEKEFQGVIFVKEIDLNTKNIKWIYFNDYVEVLTEYNKDDLLNGRVDINDIVIDIDLDSLIEELKVRGKVSSLFVIRTKSGQIRYIQEVSVVLFHTEDKLIAEGIAVDVTHTRDILNKLAETENNCNIILENNPVGCYIVQDDTYVYVNSALAKMFGCNSKNEIIGKKLEDFVYYEDLERVKNNIAKRLSGEELISIYQHRVKTKDGRIIVVEIHGSKIVYNGKNAVVGSVIDVTETNKFSNFLDARREVIEVLSTCRISDIANVLVTVLKSRYGVKFASLYLYNRKLGKFKLKCSYGNASDISGYLDIETLFHNFKSTKCLHSVDYYDSVSSKFNYFCFAPLMSHKLESSRKLLGVLILGFDYCPQDDNFDSLIEIIASYVSDLILKKRHLAVIKHQVNKLKKTLAEKDVLIREIHHRVKNNFQVILSLFSLHNKFGDEKEFVEELRYRIYTMSAVHNILYAQSDFALLNLKPYFSNLLNSLLGLYIMSEDLSKVKVDVDIDDCEQLPIDYAVPIALIINEAVSNVFKHAFNGKFENGNYINFCVRCDNDYFYFSIVDNGKGLPPNFILDNENHSGFGTYMMKFLAKSIDASFIYRPSDSGQGTEFELRVSRKNLRGVK